MTTSTYHITALGAFGARIPTSSDGYVTYHVSRRYHLADRDQLDRWSESRIRAVRAAALTQIAARRINEWRNARV